MFYREVLKKLYEEEIKFAVAGGVALVLYGVVRLTVDLDLILSLRADNIEKFISAMKYLGYAPKLPIDEKLLADADARKRWRDERNMLVFSFYHPQKPLNIIDIFIEEPILFDEIEQEMEWFSIENFRVPVISKRHLKQLKLSTGRRQDIADIDILEKLDKS